VTVNTSLGPEAVHV